MRRLIDEKGSESIIVLVVGLVPYFAQAPLSYIQYSTLPDAYLQFTLQV